YLYTENDTFQIVRLPYGNKKFEMVVILPRKSVNIDSITQSMDPLKFEAWLLSTQTQKVKLGLPKFKIAFEKSLKEVLTQLGMRTPFSQQADFSGMSGQKNLLISEVKHKTFIEVNEEGTEAAAVTGVRISLTAVPSYREMIVDRPFIFAIRERQNGTLLFLGKIVDPE
ncbi:MAG TPA: serpin family protein, partial [bacterium]|nr:serpin family protein [bacterium]